MAQAKTWVGLDVHPAKVVAAIVDSESGELRVHRLPGRTSKIGSRRRGRSRGRRPIGSRPTGVMPSCWFGC